VVNKQWLTSGVVAIGLILTLCKPVSASSSLKINDQVIETNNQKVQQQVSTAYQVLPDLFLTAKTTTVKRQKQAVHAEIQQAKAVDFQTKRQVSQKTDHQVQRQIAFKQVATSETSATTTNQATAASLPTWLWWLIGGIAVIVASLLGVYIGKQQAHFFRRHD